MRDRLARGFGADADTASGRATSPLLDQLEERAAGLEADNTRLREHIAELEGSLRESSETLEAARAMNRELMAEINRPPATRFSTCACNAGSDNDPQPAAAKPPPQSRV